MLDVLQYRGERRRLRPGTGVDVADAFDGDVFGVVGVAADDGGAVDCCGGFDGLAADHAWVRRYLQACKSVLV